MTREEKLQAMQELGEDLARDEGAVESPAWHADALRETEDRVRAGHEQAHDWEQAKERLRARSR